MRIFINSFVLIYSDVITIFEEMIGRDTSHSTELLALDGSVFEGGGGLIRYAIAYSCLLNQPIRIHSIRAKRPDVQGLRIEHTIAIQTMAKLAAASVEGNTACSRELVFIPHKHPGNSKQRLLTNMDIAVEGAASIFLIALLPYVIFSQLASHTHHITTTLCPNAEIELVIRGGTLCVKAPSIFYLRQVFLPTLNLIGIEKEHIILSEDYEQGWHTKSTKYPGKLIVRLRPLSEPLPSFTLQHRGHITKLLATVHAPKHTVGHFKNKLEHEIAELLSHNSTDASDIEVVMNVFESDPKDQYHMLLAVETSLPAAYLGYEIVYPQDDVFPMCIKNYDRKVIEHLIRVCIRGIWKELRCGNAVDEHMEDVLAIYQSLASGFSSVITKDNGRLVPEFDIDSPALSRPNQSATHTNQFF